MTKSARRTMVGLVMVLAALLAAVTYASFQPSAQAASAGQGQFQAELIVQLPPDVTSVSAALTLVRGSGEDPDTGESDFQVDSFFDVSYVSNIGSSGLDGFAPSSFQVDSFFDIYYEIDFSTRTVQTEMLSMSLTGSMSDPTDPGVVIDAVTSALKGGHVYYGHVNVIR